MASLTHAILMGAQGSGKGTQAELLGPELGLVKVSTGDLFRAAIAAGSDLGRRIQAVYDRGDLVPDDLTVSVVETRLDEIAAQAAAGAPVRGALFDGFPRTRGQAEALDAALARRRERLAAVVEIDVPLEVLVVRLAGRRVCPNCGATYHIPLHPPARPGSCDRCGHALIQREDDKPEAIRRRLALYAEQTAPLLAYYRDRGLLTTINGDRPIAEVTRELRAALAARGLTPLAPAAPAQGSPGT